MDYFHRTRLLKRVPSGHAPFNSPFQKPKTKTPGPGYGCGILCLTKSGNCLFADLACSSLYFQRFWLSSDLYSAI